MTQPYLNAPEITFLITSWHSPEQLPVWQDTINNLVSVSNAENHSMPCSEFCALEYFFSHKKNVSSVNWSFPKATKRFLTFSLLTLIPNHLLKLHYFPYIRKTTSWFQFGTTYHTDGVEIGQTANRVFKKIKMRKHRHTNIDIPGEIVGNN